MGAFDDLIPVATAPTTGAFDDLVPQRSGYHVDINPNSPNLPKTVNRNTYDPNANTYLFRPRYTSPLMQTPGDQLPLVRNPKDISEGLYNSAIKGVSAVASPFGAGLSMLGVNPVTRPLVTAGLGYLGVKGIAQSAGTIAGTPNPTPGQVAENLGDIGQNTLMLLPAAHAASDARYAYDVANNLAPSEPSSAPRPANDIVLDAEQPVKTLGEQASVPTPADQGVPGVGQRLSPGQPYAPGAFDDLVPTAEKPPIDVPTTAEPPVVEEPAATEPKPADVTQEPKGNLMSEEAANLRHDLLPLVDEGQRKTIAKYYTDTGDLAGATDMVTKARAAQKVVGTGKDAKLVPGDVALDEPTYPLQYSEGAFRDAKGRPVKNGKLIQGDVPKGDNTIGSGIRKALEDNQRGEKGFVNLQPVRDLYDRLVNSIATSGPKKDILADKDAADNAAVIVANNEGNGLRSMATGLFGDSSKRALEAVTAAVEANGDRNKLQDFIKQAQAGGDAKARARAEFAYINWDRLQPLVDRVNATHEIQYNREVAAGFNLDKREGYIQHLIDPDKLGINPNVMGSKSGGGGARGFTKMRYNDTLFEHVEKGNSSAIKSWNAADLVEHRLRAGLQGVNDAAWVEGMRNLHDPTTGQPVIRNMEKQVNPATGSEHLVAPAGYEPWSPYAGRTFAVHKGYGSFLDSVTAVSWLRNAEIAGLPVGKWLLATEGGLKHSLLLFDTFHAVRMTVKGLGFGVLRPNMGRALLEYSDRDLNQAVSNGEISQKMADYARSNRGEFNTLVKAGMNVGRVAENMDAGIWKKLPVAGTFNKWVFEKLTRSIMTQSAIGELKRQIASNPGVPRDVIARRVAKDTNLYFGNIGRQGLFHSASMADMSRLALLAPQWFESMAQTEARFIGQTAKIPLTGKVGTIARGTGTLLAAFAVLTQVGNLLTKGQPTWKNDDGHKLDMWIPQAVGKGKGFWFSPLSMPMELTHDALRYHAKGLNPLEAGSQILENKLSPLARAEEAIRVGRDYTGAKLSGWSRLSVGAKNLVPMPLPLQSAINPETSTQRQLMASAGIKAEPVEATRAEIAAGDKPLASMSLAQRRSLDKSVKAEQGPQSLTDRRLMLERSAQSEASRNEALHDSLPKAQQKWVDGHGLALPTYEDTLQMGKTRLSLTAKEKDFVEQHVTAEYSRVIDGLMQNPGFDGLSRQQQQDRVNHLMTMARGRVRVALRHEMSNQRILLTQ